MDIVFVLADGDPPDLACVRISESGDYGLLPSKYSDSTFPRYFYVLGVE